MKLQTVPARQGMLWAQQGARVFLKHPLAFASLFAAFMFSAFVLALLPWIGSLIGLALLPLVTLGFMLATRAVLGGGVPTPLVFIAPLRAERPRVVSLVWLGAIYAVTTFAAIWLGSLGGHDAVLAQLMQPIPDGQNASEVMAARFAKPGLVGSLLTGMLVRLAPIALLAIPFWHAPALIYWDGQRCAQALFSSTLACWRNRGAFVVYTLTWFGLVMLFSVAASLVFAAIGSPELFMVAGMPISLIITTMFYASLYFTFADSFAPSDPPA